MVASVAARPHINAIAARLYTGAAQGVQPGAQERVWALRAPARADAARRVYNRQGERIGLANSACAVLLEAVGGAHMASAVHVGPPSGKRALSTSVSMIIHVHTSSAERQSEKAE